MTDHLRRLLHGNFYNLNNLDREQSVVRMADIFAKVNIIVMHMLPHRSLFRNSKPCIQSRSASSIPKVVSNLQTNNEPDRVLLKNVASVLTFEHARHQRCQRT